MASYYTTGDAALQAAVPRQSGVHRHHCIRNCGAAPTRAPIAREAACVVAQQESQDRDQQHCQDAEARLGLRLESSSQYQSGGKVEGC